VIPIGSRDIRLAPIEIYLVYEKQVDSVSVTIVVLVGRFIRHNQRALSFLKVTPWEGHRVLTHDRYMWKQDKESMMSI
jgi:hypothetical protein